MVTGYDDDDDTSSCDENTETEARWGKYIKSVIKRNQTHRDDSEIMEVVCYKVHYHKIINILG